MAYTDQIRLQRRPRKSGPHDGPVRGAAARGLWFQRDGVPAVLIDGIAPAEERSLFYRRLQCRDLHRVRVGLHSEQLDVDRAATSYPPAGAGIVWSGERLPAVE